MGRGGERRAQALSRRGRRGGAGIGVGRGAARPLRQHPGTQRLWQEHVPALRGRIGDHFRRRPAGRGQAGAGPPDGMGMVFQRDALLEWRDVRRNILLPVEFAHKPAAAYATRWGAAGPDGPGEVRRELSARTVRRHAPAGRDLPGPGGRSQAAADGRALRRAGRADARPDERGAAADLDGNPQHGVVRHARHRRGGVPGRRGHGVLAASGPHPGNHGDRPAPATAAGAARNTPVRRIRAAHPWHVPAHGPDR